jgi:hypothetical protein
METKFTEQESIQLINEMIDRARNNVQKGNADSLILHGCAVAFTAIANFILLHLLPEADKNMSFMVWWLMIPSNIIDYFLKRKIDRSTIVKTQIDRIISYMWKGFGISIIVLLIILFSMSATFHSWHYFAVITSIIMIMVAMVEFGMAKACNYKPFYWGAICFWAGALLVLLSYVILKRGDVQFLILAACMIAGFVVPGYKLNKIARKNV